MLISTSPKLFSDSCLFVSTTQFQKGLVIEREEQRAALFSDLIPANVLAHAFTEAKGDYPLEDKKNKFKDELKYCSSEAVTSLSKPY